MSWMKNSMAYGNTVFVDKLYIYIDSRLGSVFLFDIFEKSF